MKTTTKYYYISLTKYIKNLKIYHLILLTTCFFTLNSIANTVKTEMRNITSLKLVEDMGVVWNLGNSLDAHGNWASGLNTETMWGNPRTTKAMIDKVKQQGFKYVRLPVTWHAHLGSYPNYTIDPEWLNRVEEIANYILENDMYVSINIHHDDHFWLIPTYATESSATNKLTKIWTQIANRFKDYGDYLIFETMNETRAIGTPEE